MWCDGDWNGFVRIALAGLLAKLPLPFGHSNNCACSGMNVSAVCLKNRDYRSDLFSLFLRRFLAKGQFQRHFGSDQSVWCGGEKERLCENRSQADFLLEDLVFYDSSASIKGDALFL